MQKREECENVYLYISPAYFISSLFVLYIAGLQGLDLTGAMLWLERHALCNYMLTDRESDVDECDLLKEQTSARSCDP